MSDKKLTEPVGNSNRLTDEEIIKVLEYCSNYNDCDKCNFEPKDNKKKTIGCCLEIMKNAIDLITRQQAEIERLRSANDEKFRQWDMLAEKTKQHYADLYNEAKDILKAEAYKEFAERLKNEIISDTAYGCDTSQHTGYYDYQIKIGDIPEYIDNILKEMVG